MSALNQLGGKLIAERIRAEAMKAIEKNVQSAVLNALLPQSAENGSGGESAIPVQLEADLTLNLARAEIFYTEHLGKDSEKSLALPDTRKELKLCSLFSAKRPEAMAQSRKIGAHGLSLTLEGTLAGIAFQQKIMGCGATIHTVAFRVSVSGNASAEWLDAPEEKA